MAGKFTALKFSRQDLIPLTLLMVVAVLKFNFHELWKDEWQAWLVARDMSFTQILGFLNYEGHPAMWYLYLKPWTFLSSVAKEDILLSLAHLLAYSVALFLLFRHQGLSLAEKLAFALSYFLFFEYGIINRGYILVVLTALWFVHSLKSGKNLHAIASMILLCQTEVYGTMMAMVMLFYLVWQDGWTKHKTPLIALATGLIIFIISVFPRGNDDDFTRAYVQGGFSFIKLQLAFQGMLGNTFGIGFFTDTSFGGLSSTGILLSFIALAATTAVFYPQKKLYQTWLLAVLGFVLFSTLVFNGGVRQWGMLFITFLMLRLIQSQTYSSTKWQTGIVLALCVAPIIHNLKAIREDIRLPFSNAKAAGAFIAEKIPANVPIVSLNKFETAAAAAYAVRKMYQLPSGTPFTYFHWLQKVYVPTQTELILFAKYKKVRGLIIVSNTPIDEKRFPLLKLWKSFTDENFKSENFYFYVLDLTAGMG